MAHRPPSSRTCSLCCCRCRCSKRRRWRMPYRRDGTCRRRARSRYRGTVVPGSSRGRTRGRGRSRDPPWPSIRNGSSRGCTPRRSTECSGGQSAGGSGRSRGRSFQTRRTRIRRPRHRWPRISRRFPRNRQIRSHCHRQRPFRRHRLIRLRPSPRRPPCCRRTTRPFHRRRTLRQRSGLPPRRYLNNSRAPCQVPQPKGFYARDRRPYGKSTARARARQPDHASVINEVTRWHPE
jgi:hypothetical protein